MAIPVLMYVGETWKKLKIKAVKKVMTRKKSST